MNKKRLIHALCHGLLLITKPLLQLLTRINTSLTTTKTITGFTPRPDDIFLVTYPKSGTTWLQMILYQITTDGDLDKIEHISRAIPHLEESQKGRAINLQKMATPRIFKTHLTPKCLPIGGKMIYVMRDGMDVAVSYYHHMQAQKGYPGDFKAFFNQFLEGQVPYGSWFHHMAAWLEHRNNPHLLFLRFEEMKTDLPGVIAKIADFCQLEIDPDQMPRILERCSFQYMQNHQDKLDLTALFLFDHGRSAQRMIRKGEVGEGIRSLDDNQREAFEKSYRTHLSEFEASW